MSSKSKIPLSLVLVMAAVAGIAFAAAYIFKGSTNSSVSPNSAMVPQAALQDSGQIPAQSSRKGNYEVVEASDVSVSLVSWNTAPATASAVAIQVEVCIQLPSTENWISEASLIVGEQTIPAFGWGLLNPKDPATYTGRHRCYQLDFALPEGGQTQAAPLRFVVERLFIPPPMMPTEEQCAQAQQKLDEAGRGIKFSCWYPDGGGGWGYDVLNKPQGMSEEQVASLIYEALREKVVEGPWEFTLSVP